MLAKFFLEYRYLKISKETFKMEFIPFNVNNRKTRKRCEICYIISIVDFEQVNICCVFSNVTELRKQLSRGVL